MKIKTWEDRVAAGEAKGGSIGGCMIDEIKGLRAWIDQLKIERDALALDASRYRWLRNQVDHQFRALAYETPEWIDAYIDEMKGTS